MDELPQVAAFRQAMLEAHNVVVGDVAFDVVYHVRTKDDNKKHKEGNYPEKHSLFLHLMKVYGATVDAGWWLTGKVVSTVKFKHKESR